MKTRMIEIDVNTLERIKLDMQTILLGLKDMEKTSSICNLLKTDIPLINKILS